MCVFDVETKENRKGWKMSEKKLIDFETFCKNCLDYIGEDRKCMRVWSPRTYDECSKECPEWLALSKPTLADVCGTRTLDSMDRGGD